MNIHHHQDIIAGNASSPIHEAFAHIVVAGIIERDGKFLMVRENTEQGEKINQPAGHWERGESLIDAVVREVREETAYDFTPQSIIGLYTFTNAQAITYLRLAFAGKVADPPRPTALDRDICEVLWWDHATLLQNQIHLRSPMTLRGIEDYLRGKSFPLSLIETLERQY